MSIHNCKIRTLAVFNHAINLCQQLSNTQINLLQVTSQGWNLKPLYLHTGALTHWNILATKYTWCKYNNSVTLHTLPCNSTNGRIKRKPEERKTCCIAYHIIQRSQDHDLDYLPLVFKPITASSVNANYHIYNDTTVCIELMLQFICLSSWTINQFQTQ